MPRPIKGKLMVVDVGRENERRRLTIPLAGGRFAYVDFTSKEHEEAAIALSEQLLRGRALLIKSAKDFEKKGAPKKANAPTASGASFSSTKSKTTPSPTLFVGNLPFEATVAGVKGLFVPFGPVRKVRLMTFEDTGKCKGFAYVDFMEQSGAEMCMSERKPLFLEGRKLRVEFGSAEAARRGAPWIHDPKGLNGPKKEDGGDGESRKRGRPEEDEEERKEGGGGGRRARRRERLQGAAGGGSTSRSKGGANTSGGAGGRFPPPGPERASAAVVPFTGTKVTFGEDEEA